ncbi:hypothetical protein I4U23_025131 [Adineta vaga]|nr:hypothetical protein I4U23_025131 [Adineta vaga]
MVLIIGEQVYSRKCTLEDLEEHADLISSSREFAKSNEYKQLPDEISRTIYVHQREFAVIGRSDPNGFHLIGSDDATTCHILVLDNQCAVGVIHLDGEETDESLENMLDEMKKYAPDNTNYDAYLVGGFIDGSTRQYSHKLSNEVLKAFSSMKNVSFHLKLAAITPYNDHIINKIHYPLIYGICFDVNTKTIRKMNFIDFGPAFRLRSVYLSVHTHCAWCIYSSLQGIVTIKEFSIDKNIVKRYYEPLYLYYFYNDQKLLSMTSTSPEQERSSYLTHIKKNILFILKYFKELSEWFDKQTHSIVYYRLNEKWITNNTNVIEDVEI